MNLQEMSTRTLMFHLMNLSTKVADGWADTVSEIQRRLNQSCSPKQPYTIHYKFMPNDQDIQKLPGFTVWGSSPLAACQAMVDVNNWRGQNMEFLVETEASGVCVTSKQLE